MEHYTALLSTVSPVAALLAATAMMLVGALWYSNRLFGRSWRRHSGIRPGDIRPHEVRRGYAIAAMVALLTACLIGIVAAHATGPAALFGSVAFLWLFIMFEQLGGCIWRREPFALFLVHTFRSLFSLQAGALVFYLWSFFA